MVEVTKMINVEDTDANIYINKIVYSMFGNPLGTLEEVRISSGGNQEFWVRNEFGLMQFYYFCIP
jgi:hypothetical protein